MRAVRWAVVVVGVMATIGGGALTGNNVGVDANIAAIVGAAGSVRTVGTSYNVTSKGPTGMSIFVQLAQKFGQSFLFTDKVPDPAHVDVNEIVVVAGGHLAEAEQLRLQSWVANGGTVVSIGYGFYTGAEPDPIAQGVASQNRARCDIPTLDHITTANFSGARAYENSRFAIDEQVCFSTETLATSAGTSFVKSLSTGDGRVTLVASFEPFLNRSIATDDNAALVTALVAPSHTTKVHMVGRYFTGGSNSGNGSSGSSSKDNRSLTDLISPGLKQGFLQLLVAFLLYAIWRARRVGRPLVESLPISIDARDITTARGALLARAKRPASAAVKLQGRFVADVVKQTGLPASHIVERMRATGVTEPADVDSDRSLAAFASQLRQPRDWHGGTSDLVATQTAISLSTSSVTKAGDQL